MVRAFPFKTFSKRIRVEHEKNINKKPSTNRTFHYFFCAVLGTVCPAHTGFFVVFRMLFHAVSVAITDLIKFESSSSSMLLDEIHYS